MRLDDVNDDGIRGLGLVEEETRVGWRRRRPEETIIKWFCVALGVRLCCLKVVALLCNAFDGFVLCSKWSSAIIVWKHWLKIFKTYLTQFKYIHVEMNEWCGDVSVRLSPWSAQCLLHILLFQSIPSHVADYEEHSICLSFSLSLSLFLSLKPQTRKWNA